MTGARARFWPVSLLIDADCEPESLDPAGLWPFGPAKGDVRALFHEAVHYWQNLSQSFLVRLADEDWQRLLSYERTGTVLGPGEVRRAFDGHGSSTDWSARDLHECLARFWDLIAAGPRRVLEEEWAAGRATALRDVRELHRRRRSEANWPAGAWDGEDLAAAMLMVAGEYASPFLTIAGQELEHAVFLFPWLAHFALQTSAPVEAFDRFVGDLGPELAQIATELLKTPGVALTDRFEFTMVQLFRSASELCQVSAEGAGDPVRTASRAFAESSLDSHPVYSWSFRGPVLRTADALAKAQLAEKATQVRGASPDPGRRTAGISLLARVLATPGLPESRTVLLTSGVVPPCVRYSDGALQPLGGVFRAGLATWPDEWKEVDVLWKITQAARDLDLASEELLAAKQCEAIQQRWEVFVKAARGGPSRG
jgi:hypothetical protein